MKGNILIMRSTHLIASVMLLSFCMVAECGLAASHEKYPGFAEPIQSFSLSEDNVAFSSEAGTVPLGIGISDDAVYMYGYASYNGGSWQRFELSGGLFGGDWLSGSVSSEIVSSPESFGLSAEKAFSGSNFIVVYSCSRLPDDWDCHGGWQIAQFNASLDDGSCHGDSCGFAESDLLRDVPLIHDQTFLLPENAEEGDTVGDMNLMWVGPDQGVEYDMVDNDDGRFTLERLTGRDCVSNHNLDYEVRISVGNADFDYDSAASHSIILRATDMSTGLHSDATITVRLSESEKTVFVDPSWTGCHTGTRSCPYATWDDVTGGYNDGIGILTPGYAYLQKRGTTTMDILNIYQTANPDEHIMIGAYGEGERPIFDGTSAMSWLEYGTGIRLGTTNTAEEPRNVGYYDIYSLMFTNWWCGILTNRMGPYHNTFTDILLTHNTGPGMYLYSDYRNGQSNIDILNNTIIDTVSEYSGGYNNDYGFKSEAGGTIFRYTVARFNLDIGFAGASGGYDGGYFYCQAYDSYDGIKVHGDDTVIDHTLIQDNEHWGINNGNYYQLNYGLSSTNFRIRHSLVKDNGVGIHVSQDADHGIIQNTDFIGNGRAIGFYRDGSFEGAPNHYLITSSRFIDNDEAIVIGNSQSPYPYDINMSYNIFLDNAGILIKVIEGINVHVYNNIFYGNGGSYDISVDRDLPFAARNNLLEDGIHVSVASAHTVDHNMDHENSFFVDASSRDFHLVSGCPAIDAGILVGMSQDFDGTPITDGMPDVGAFEYQGA